jgi:alkanesulfonate monooxygenase SsuD/methylene tetrahydromethanopterin reductase-like flavin-dependent oxidoreductase (luciferase family)
MAGLSMKFGLFGGARTKRSDGATDSHAYGDFIAYVSEAERLGFRSVFLVEHHFTGAGQISASLTLLAYLAARTRSIRLWHRRHCVAMAQPVLLAEQAATVDLLSDGRLDLGVGKGYRAGEFAGFHIPMDEATERFDEAIDVIRKAWTSPWPLLASRHALALRRHRRRAATLADAPPAAVVGRRQSRFHTSRRARGL